MASSKRTNESMHGGRPPQSFRALGARLFPLSVFSLTVTTVKKKLGSSGHSGKTQEPCMRFGASLEDPSLLCSAEMCR